MLSRLVYVVRLLLSFCIVLLGLGLLLATATSKKRNAYTIGLPIAVAAAGVLSWPRSLDAWRREPPTEKQLAYAKDLGISLRPGLTKGQVSDLISEFKNRV